MNTNTKTLLTALATAGLIAGTASTQAATLINYSFDTVVGQGNVPGVNLSDAVGSTLEGVGGMGAGTTWNQGGYTNLSTIKDSAGVDTAVSFTTSGINALRTEGSIDDGSAPTTDSTIFRGIAVADGGNGRGATVNLTYTGLASEGVYDIWLYSMRVNGNANETTGMTVSTTNTTASSASQILDNNATGGQAQDAFNEGGNYLFFDDVVADISGEIDFTLVGAAFGQAGFESFTDTRGLRPSLGGFQIQVVPEPGSLALMGLGGLLIARRRRG